MTNSIFLKDTTPVAIAKLMSSVDTKKSLDPESVPTFIRKSSIHLFSQIIFLYYKSIFP